MVASAVILLLSFAGGAGGGGVEAAANGGDDWVGCQPRIATIGTTTRSAYACSNVLESHHARQVPARLEPELCQCVGGIFTVWFVKHGRRPAVPGGRGCHSHAQDGVQSPAAVCMAKWKWRFVSVPINYGVLKRSATRGRHREGRGGCTEVLSRCDEQSACSRAGWHALGGSRHYVHVVLAACRCRLVWQWSDTKGAGVHHLKVPPKLFKINLEGRLEAHGCSHQ